MPEPYFLTSLCLAGFRAYLKPKAFDFKKKRCLAIFAPNGNGKSSVIDGLEFMFSKEGTLDRLGQRAANTKAGFTALAHNKAEAEKIPPTVSIGAMSGNTALEGNRPAAGAKRPMPVVAATLNEQFKVLPIIRGHQLRSFVEEKAPEQRYTEVASWLQLTPLVEVQKNLRALRTQVKQAADDDASLKRLDAQIARDTAQSVKLWDDAAVLAHINDEVLTPLDPALTLSSLAADDPTYVELEARAKAEESEVGLAGLRQIRGAATALWAEGPVPDTGESIVTGAIPAFEAAVTELQGAEELEAEERGKAANAAFREIWKAAEPLFAEGAPAPNACPVCATPLAATSAGSAEGVRGHIAEHLAELAEYAKAKKALESAKAAATKTCTQLSAALPPLIGLLLGKDDDFLKNRLVAYRASIDEWRGGTSPDSTGIVAMITDLTARLSKAMADIEARQGDHTYSKAKASIDRLLVISAERDLALRTQAELRELSESLTEQSTFISSEIRQMVQSLLDTLQKPMNDLYELIQGDRALSIRLELPGEEDANQQRLNLLIDFSDNRTGVQPSGYLSDSQIHSVALALWLAAIKRFNTGAPIIALDDVVTSYDADHRRSIAGLIGAAFNEHQILIATHDERFFRYLIDQLEPKSWHFTRITGLDPVTGPRFADHKVSDDMIEERWADGQSAANEMRQAEEEWLLGICRDFGVSLRIRPLEKAYSYERSELATALASYLNKAKLNPALVPGVNNRFLTSLAKGEIENFGSHFQDSPYGDGSNGDEKTRWNEFKAFRAQFGCKKCRGTKFQRPFSLKKPVCAHESCETQFEFAET